MRCERAPLFLSMTEGGVVRQEHPDNFHAQYNLAMARTYQHNYDDAVGAFEAAARIRPEDVSTLQVRMVCCVHGPREVRLVLCVHGPRQGHMRFTCTANCEPPESLAALTRPSTPRWPFSA